MSSPPFLSTIDNIYVVSTELEPFSSGQILQTNVFWTMDACEEPGRARSRDRNRNWVKIDHDSDPAGTCQIPRLTRYAALTASRRWHSISQ